MGQYFKAVNETKREVVCPWCLSSGSKLWEWSANPIGAVFTILLRRSSGTGGGDFNAGPTVELNTEAMTQEEIKETLARAVLKEGQPTHFPSKSVVGSWAGDKICLVGDYDDSGLYEEAASFKNISSELAEDWNKYIELKSHQLVYANCGCQEHNKS